MSPSTRTQVSHRAGFERSRTSLDGLGVSRVLPSWRDLIEWHLDVDRITGYLDDISYAVYDNNMITTLSHL